MEVNIREDKKIVEVWLTREEKKNEEIKNKLKPMMKQYKEKRYMVVLFESGEQDLAEMTSALLLYNRRRIAELEVTKQKEAETEDSALSMVG